MPCGSQRTKLSGLENRKADASGDQMTVPGLNSCAGPTGQECLVKLDLGEANGHINAAGPGDTERLQSKRFR